MLALAFEDTEPLVQTTACGLVTKLAEPEDERAWAGLMKLVRDGSSDTRVAILAELRVAAPDRVWQVVVQQLSVASPQVRASARNALGRTRRFEELKGPWKQLAFGDIEYVQRSALRSWICVEGSASLIGALATAEAAAVALGLEALREMGKTIPHEALDALVAREEGPIDMGIWLLCEAGVVTPHRLWLLEFVRRLWTYAPLPLGGSQWPAGREILQSDRTGFATCRRSLIEALSSISTASDQPVLSAGGPYRHVEFNSINSLTADEKTLCERLVRCFTKLFSQSMKDGKIETQEDEPAWAIDHGAQPPPRREDVAVFHAVQRALEAECHA